MTPQNRKQLAGAAGGAKSAESSAAQSIAHLFDFPLALVLVDILNERVVAANSAAQGLFGTGAEPVVGRFIHAFLFPESLASAKRDFADLRAGRFEGYQVRGKFVTPGGDPFVGEVWVRRLDGSINPPQALVCVVPSEGDRDEESYGSVITVHALPSFMMITDRDWRIEHVSAEVASVLGIAASSIIGVPLLGLVHPGDAPEFLFALTRAITSHRGTVCRARIRAEDHPWRDIVCIVHPLSDDSPPLLGIMALGGKERERPDQSATEELEQVLARFAMEIRAAGVVPKLPEILEQANAGVMAQLTSRQWEIVTRLSQGENASKIAAAMYVSPSTVRNQLTAIYRKFGVHSQLELLSLLRA